MYVCLRWFPALVPACVRLPDYRVALSEPKDSLSSHCVTNFMPCNLEGVLTDGMCFVHLLTSDDFGYMPRGTNGALRHGILYNAK